MRRTMTAALAAVLALTSLGGAAMAQPMHDRHDNGYQGNAGDNGRRDNGYQGNAGDNGRRDNGNHYGANNGHHDWRRGGRIDRADWSRGQRVDWRRHHLRSPPRGYEWRQVDNQYVLAAATTGLIASILASSR